MKKSFLRFSAKRLIVWTLISALIGVLYGAGIYMLYDESVGFLGWDSGINDANLYYLLYSMQGDPEDLEHANNRELSRDYSFFAKIEKDGSLTDICKTDYDCVEAVLTGDLDGKQYRLPQEASELLKGQGSNKGKINTLELMNKAQYNAVITATFVGDSDPDLISSIARRIAGRLETLVREIPRLLDFALEDEYNGKNDSFQISSASLDDETGMVSSGILDLDGGKITFSDGTHALGGAELSGSYPPERPDELLNKYEYLFLPENNNAEYLAGLDKQMRSLQSDNLILSNRLAKLVPVSIEQYEENESTEDYFISRGVIKVNDDYYRFLYIIPIAGFGKVGTPLIVKTTLVVFVTGLVLLLLLSIPSYIKYTNDYNNRQFKNGLIDALAHNLKTPMQVITVNSESLNAIDNDPEHQKFLKRILDKTSDMNKAVETILKTAERDPVKTLFRVREAVEATASKLGVDVEITGDRIIKADRELFEQALFNLIDNAERYKSENSEITVRIDRRKMLIENRVKEDKFTPGAGMAMADRYLTQTGMSLIQRIKDGRFRSEIKY